jgi:hypothetical protein
LAALNIKDPEVHELAAELARRTKRSLTEAVKERQRSDQADSQRVVERVMRIAQRSLTSRPRSANA